MSSGVERVYLAYALNYPGQIAARVRTAFPGDPEFGDVVNVLRRAAGPHEVWIANGEDFLFVSPFPFQALGLNLGEKELIST